MPGNAGVDVEVLRGCFTREREGALHAFELAEEIDRLVEEIRMVRSAAYSS